MNPPPVEAREGCVWIRVRVQPKASRDSITIEEDGRIRVSITAPPADNEANRAVCAFLAKRLGVSKSSVRVVKGEKAREKVIAVDGAGVERVEENLYRG